MLGKPDVEPEMGNTADITAFIGTVFLWIYWPSFVAGTVPIHHHNPILSHPLNTPFYGFIGLRLLQVH